MILITGANGHLGRATIDFLQKKGVSEQLAGLVRDPGKVEGFGNRGIDVRKGDYLDRDSLRKAFTGVEKLAFISSGSLENRVQQHKNVIDVAKEVGVQHILYTSVLNPSPTAYFTPAIDHYETEEYLKASGITYTFLRNAFYSETVPMLIGDAMESGKIFFAAGDGKVCFAARTDMAEALACALVGSGHEDKTYDIATNVAYSFNDVARMLSEVAGKEIEYVDIPEEGQRHALQEIGLDEGLIEMTMGVAATIKHSAMNSPGNDLEMLLGRKPAELKTYFERSFLNQD